MIPHPDLARFEALWPYIEQFQALASDHGIDDVFQDNGGKLLQTILRTSLVIVPGRLGNDAIDEAGMEYELKTVNVDKAKGVSTHHHLNEQILAKYRQVPWLICLYSGIKLMGIYRVTPQQMEPYMEKWDRSLRQPGKDHLNNPKVRVSWVVAVGTAVFEDPEFEERLSAMRAREQR